MKPLGILVLAAGIAVGMFGFAMDTSAPIAAAEKQRGYMGMRPEEAEPVADAALVAKRKIWLWVGGFLAVAGLVMTVVKVRPADGGHTTDDDSYEAGGEDAWVVEHELHKKNKRQQKQPVYEQRYEEDDYEDEDGVSDDDEADYEPASEDDDDEREANDNVHNITATLVKLNELRKEGVLTDEEFNTQKAKLLRQK